MSGKKSKSPPQADVKYRNPGVAGFLSTNQLTSGLRYQRPVEKKDVTKLIREWDPRKLTPIVVSAREGKFNVVDGQHRVEAMRRMAKGKDVSIPCLIYTGMTYADEAALYAELDRGRKRLTLPQSLNAMVEAGTDPEIMEVKRLAESAGFVWALVKRTGQPFEIEATRALISAYRLLGVAGFSRLLELMAGTWHGAPNSLKASMLSGMALFLKTYEVELNDRTFIRRLSTVEPEEIIQASRVEYSAALRFARTIRDKYNAQGGGQELPYRFKR